MSINEKDRKKLRSQLYTDTSSNTVIEQFNSRSASTMSSCKLINSIKEKRKKLLIQQSPNFSHEKSSDDNTVHDNRALRHRINRKELSEAGKAEADVKVNAENVSCKDMTSLTKDGCYCKDTGDIDVQRDSSYSTVPCSSFSVCDNIKRPQSWNTTYPSEARAKLNDSDVFLSRAICTDVERKDYRESNGQNNILGDESESIVYHAVDDSKLPKSIYTDCVTYGENPKECYADNYKYRNKILQESVINDIWKRQVGYNKLSQQSLGSCQREQVARKWSTCSCITEEEEDYCKSIDRVEKELSENVCNVIECLEKISVCQTPSRKLAENATVCETSFSASGKCLEKTRTCKELAKRSKDICGTKFGNLEEPSKVTRVCKEFVTEEPSKDITVCKTVFGEPNGLAEEVIVYRTAFPDSKDTLKETICKEILDSNFANQDDVNRLSLNDAEDKLVGENIDSSNLNDPKENGNKRIVNLNNKQDNGALNNFTRQQSVNVEQHEQIKKTLNDQSKNLHQIPVESIKDFKPLSKNVYSTTLRAQRYNRSNLVNQQRMQSLNRLMRNHSQRSNNFMQNLASNKNNQLEEKTQENSKEEKEEKQDISKEVGTTEDKQKDSLSHRFKKLIDVIRRGRTLVTDRIEIGKIEAKKAIADDKQDDEKLKITSETGNESNNIKNQQEITKKVAIPIRSPQTETANKEGFLRPKPIAPVIDFTILEKGKKMDVQRTDQTMPKLLRIIAVKKSHVLSTEVTTDFKPQESEDTKVVPAKIITTVHVDQEEIPEEKVILQEYTPAEITEEIKMDDSIAPEMSTAIKTSIEDAPKDVADEDRISKDIRDETTKIYVTCPQKKTEKESRKSIHCKCGLLSDSSARTCSIAKCAKDRVPCPQKSEEEPQKFTLCKCELACNSNNYSCSIVKCTKCNNIIEDCPSKDNRFERKKIYCARCSLSTVQCTCAPDLKSYLKINKYRDVSPLKISSHICTNCCKSREERKCRKTTVCCYSHKECRCRCATHGDCSRINDKRKCGSQASCINCGRPRNQCCCTAFALVKCHKIKGGCNRNGTMICLYCDNPQDKCTCRAPIGKCSYCGLPSDVCDCQDDESHARDYEQIARRPDENRTIRVTSWKPKREIRRYFARNFEDFRSCSTEECQCYEKPKRQRPEKLPYQWLNIFSEVMNELQQKMSESVCCARCWRNPCCCGSPVDQDKRKGEKKAENRVKHAEMERSPRSKSPNNCWCSSNSRNERKSTVRKSINQIPIRHIGCICRLTPYKCKKDIFNCKRPLAKCYYCKNLPCTCDDSLNESKDEENFTNLRNRHGKVSDDV